MGWDGLNLITTLGSFLLALGILLLLVNVVAQPAPWRGRAGPIPGMRRRWNGRRRRRRRPTISRVIPHVASRHPLWEDRLEESDERSSLDGRHGAGPRRETVGTTPLDG